MKNILSIFVLLISIVSTSFGQNNYATLSNRVLLSGIVNNDTILIENLNNQVRVNGEFNIISVTYSNLTSRFVGDNQPSRDRSDISILFENEYNWIDERIKNANNIQEFSDEIVITLGNEEETVPVNFVITRINAGHGFLVMIQISGKFSAKALKQDFPNLDFKEDLNFQIYLTVQVTQ